MNALVVAAMMKKINKNTNDREKLTKMRTMMTKKAVTVKTKTTINNKRHTIIFGAWCGRLSRSNILTTVGVGRSHHQQVHIRTSDLPNSVSTEDKYCPKGRTHQQVWQGEKK